MEMTRWTGEYSFYNGIRIRWDEDKDKRIFTFIDSLSKEEKNQLVGAGESKGCLFLNWLNEIPERFIGSDCIKVENDIWSLHHNIEPNQMEKEIKLEQSVYRVIKKQDRYEVLKRQKWRCNNCNELLKMSKHSEWDGEVAHIDHIHPYSKKESYTNGEENINELSNLQALCPKCNLSKGKKKIN